MARKGNITGEVFDDSVIKQIEIRQNFLGQRNKTDKNLVYTNNQSSFLRLASSINIGDDITTSLKVNTTSSINVKNETEELANKNSKSTIVTKYGDETIYVTERDQIEEGKNQLRSRGIGENMIGMELAKSCVLFGGVVGVDNNLNPITKFGINDPSSPDPINTISAYGWGGLGSRGYVPMPALESANVSFYNRGAIQKADIKIKVYSLEQLQIFDVLYFRIGYSMLLEWGHNLWIDNDGETLKNRNEFVTDPFKFFFEEGKSQQDIFKSIQTQRKKESYNYDAMLGKVTNFTWKFNDDGSYDINLKLIGMGDIIESLKINKTSPSNSKALTPTEKLSKGKTNVVNAENAINNRTKKDQEKVAKAEKDAKDKIDSINEKIKAISDKYVQNILKLPSSTIYASSTTTAEGQGQNTITKGDVIKDDANLPGWLDPGVRDEITAFVNQEINGLTFTADIDPTTNEATLVSINDKLADLKGLYNPQPALFTRKRTYKDEGVTVTETLSTFEYTTSRKGKFVGGEGNIDAPKLDKILDPIFKKLNKNLAQIYELIPKDGIDQNAIQSAKDAAEASQSRAEQQKANLNRQKQALEARDEQLKLSPETSEETQNKSLFNQQLFKWRKEAKGKKGNNQLYKLTFKSSSANPNTTGKKYISLDFYYVRLGYLLEWVQNNLLVYDPSKKDLENKDAANPIFTLDYAIENNFCLRFGGQFSSDPSVCVIPSLYSKNGIEWNILPDLNSQSPYFIEGNDEAGLLMNLMVNIDNIAGILDRNLDSNGKVNLNTFLKALLNDINDALGNVNKLEPIFNTEENKLIIIDANNVPNVSTTDGEKTKNIMGVFNVYGIGTLASQMGSFVNNVDFQVQLPPNMAAMATISAQANGNIVGENATGLSKLNTGFTDRLITFKLDADSIEGATTIKSEEDKFNETLKLVNKSVNDLYGNSKTYAVDTIKSMRSNNRDIALYLTGTKQYLKKSPSPFFIPFNLKLDMQGLSGMKNYERFSITEDVLPYSYRSGDQGGVINFLIKGVSHKIDNNKWTTSIETLSVGALPK